MTPFIACGDSGTSNRDALDAAPIDDDAAITRTEAGIVDAAAPYPASHPAAPQVVKGPGSVLANPRVVPIFYAGYDYEPQIVDFLSKLGKSAYWKANVSEYGVGALTAGTKIELTEPAPTSITSVEIVNWLTQKLDGTHPEFGAADPNTIYAIYFPPQTVVVQTNAPRDDAGGIDASDGLTSCVEFRGYHSEAAVGNVVVPLAVLAECAHVFELTGVDGATETTSHELVEAVTDPHPFSTPAYWMTDNAHWDWTIITEGELGDMCLVAKDRFYKDEELQATVQRCWSNAAAAAGHNPCVPSIPNLPYFNSVPGFEDDIPNLLPNELGYARIKGVTVPVGKSKTVPVYLFSDAPTENWSLAARELKSDVNARDSIAVTFDKTEGKNGDVLQMTVKALSPIPGQTYLILESTLGTRVTRWFGTVRN